MERNTFSDDLIYIHEQSQTSATVVHRKSFPSDLSNFPIRDSVRFGPTRDFICMWLANSAIVPVAAF